MLLKSSTGFVWADNVVAVVVVGHSMRSDRVEEGESLE
jgi:hypothetical protein